MIKLKLLFLVLIANFSTCFTQNIGTVGLVSEKKKSYTNEKNETLESRDTIQCEKGNNSQGVYAEIFYPAFPSSIGYFFEHSMRHISINYGFALCAAPVFFNRSWNYGTSFQQTFLFGKKIRPKVGIYEIFCLNPQKMQGRFDAYTYSDRPPAFSTAIGVFMGIDFPIVKNKFYLSPLITAGKVIGTKDTPNQKNTFKIDQYHTSWIWSFGLNFKVEISKK